MKNRDKFLISTILGGAIGTAVGMLLAPKSGKETRNIVKDVSKEFVNKGRGVIEKISNEHGDEIVEVVDDIKSTAHDALKSIKKILK